jgi:ribosomal-protein-alanine N-acetyltransferase
VMPDTRVLKIILRPMTLEDVPRVREIDVLSFSLPWSERSYRFEVAENPHASCWVAEWVHPDGRTEVVGMMVNWVILDELHIATLAVHPDYRRMGIARRLLAKGLQAGLERGARLAFLEVRRSNLAAQNLYRAFGFELSGVRPRYYKDNFEDALLMTLEPLTPEAIPVEEVEEGEGGASGLPE